ncbi:unnamed protein product [Candida parapsilosis]
MSSQRKTREELLADFENDLVKFISMSLTVEGHDEPLVFSRDMDPMPQRLHFILPEYSVYYLTIRYKVKQRPLKKLTYHQTVKKGVVKVDTRDLKMIEDAVVNDHEDDGDYHEVTFPAGGVPGGSFLRGCIQPRVPYEKMVRRFGVIIGQSKFVKSHRSHWLVDLIK